MCLLNKFAVALIKAVIYCDKIQPSQVICFPGSNKYGHINATGKLKLRIS